MKIVTLLSLALISSSSFAQNFTNGDFVGEVNSNKYSVVPDGWEAVSHTESFCQATSSVCATIDLASIEGPALFHGNAGKPQSGTTFMSGLLAQSGTHIWHEGIKQNVSGLEPGEKYELSFYQAVVKQSNKTSFYCYDKTGAWSVYADGVLLETTKVSRSTRSADDLDLSWEMRKIEFIASAESQTFAFMPADNDRSIESEKDKEGLRMGLDNVSLKIYEEPAPPRQVEEIFVCELLSAEMVEQIIEESKVQKESVLSIEPEHLELLVYPNPTRDYARLKISEEYTDVAIQLYDMQGKLVFTNEFNRGDDLRFKLDGETGTYLLRVKVDNRQWEVLRVQKSM